MKLLGTALVFSMLLALACGRANGLRTPEPPGLDPTVQAVVPETQTTSKATAEIDIEATINARGPGHGSGIAERHAHTLAHADPGYFTSHRSSDQFHDPAGWQL